ncbi:MAG: peptide chain release factor 2, partial [Myxococcales bacterium]|nr:peptide chain release factor 2 [Myxococcales bacterium]
MSSEPNFWNDQVRAQALMKERQDMFSAIESLEAREQTCTDLDELIELVEFEDDDSMVAEIEEQIQQLESVLDRAEFERMMSSSNDRND